LLFASNLGQGALFFHLIQVPFLYPSEKPRIVFSRHIHEILVLPFLLLTSQVYCGGGKEDKLLPNFHGECIPWPALSGQKRNEKQLGFSVENNIQDICYIKLR